MSLGDEAGEGYDAATARGRDWPSVRQFNVFLSNRLGALLDLLRRFEQTDVRVVSLAVIETSDCAIIRLVPSDYERGYEILTSGKIPFTDLTVKYCHQDEPPTLKSWCVFLMGAVMFVDASLDPALETARQLAVEYACTAWLVTDGCQPIAIGLAHG